MKIKLKHTMSWIVFIFALISCGGGGGGDGSSNKDSGSSVISSIGEEVEELAFAAKEISTQIMETEENDIDDAIVRLFDESSSSKMSASFSVATFIKENLPVSSSKKSVLLATSVNTLQPFGTDSKSGTVYGDCGGSATYTYKETYDDSDYYPATFDIYVTLNDFCYNLSNYGYFYDGTMTIDGTATIDGTMYTDSEATFTYDYDLTYESDISGIGSGSLHYAETCDVIYDAYDEDKVDYTCSVGVYEGDSASYYTSSVTVSENTNSGYDISYSLVDSDGNRWSVEFSRLTLCDGGNIGSGNGTIEYNSNVIAIEFLSCSQFQVTYDGDTETYDQ